MSPGGIDYMLQVFYSWLIGVRYYLLVGFCATCCLFTSYFALSARSSGSPLIDSDVIKDAMVLQDAMRQIYKTVNPAVVRIEIEDTVEHPFANDPTFKWFFNVPRGQGKQKRKGFVGSGFVLNTKGFIITNHHVISRNRSKQYVEKVKVAFTNGITYDAKIIGSDPASDIALLKIQPKSPLKHVYIGDSSVVEVGDFAIAIGNPFGLSSTFTMGVISSKSQNISTTDGIPRLQTDAPINPGNSGGPLLNIRGEVIGINQMIYTRSGGSLGIGFAIPINYAMDITEKLRTGAAIKHGYIGISVIPEPNAKQKKELRIPDKQVGLLVGQVELGSPAWKGGVRPYDYIIKLDGRTVKKFADLKGLVVSKGVGKAIKIGVLRNATKINLTVVIGEVRH